MLTTTPERSGAHRPRRSPLLELVPATVVVLALLAVGVGLFQLRDTALGGADVASTSSPRPAAASEPASKPTPTSPAPGGTGSTPTTQAVGKVERDTAVGVYNGTTTSGLASRVSQLLREDRWQARAVGNFRDRTVPTTVFYSSAELEATAQAVAEDLGGQPAVQQSDDFDTEGISVVLGSDYVEPGGDGSGQ